MRGRWRCGGGGRCGGGEEGHLLPPALLPLVLLAQLRDTEGMVLLPLDLAPQPPVGPLQLDHRLVKGGGGTVRGCSVVGGGTEKGVWHGEGCGTMRDVAR